jgi:hypothetical protein
LLFISYWIGIRCLIQILFSYCFLLIYSVFKLVQSTKTQYLSHQGEKIKIQVGPWNSEYQKFNTSVNQIYTCFALASFTNIFSWSLLSTGHFTVTDTTTGIYQLIFDWKQDSFIHVYTEKSKMECKQNNENALYLT